MPGYIDAQGRTQQLSFAVTDYRVAAEAGMTLPQYINAQHPTNVERDGSAWDQLLASEGIFVRPNREFGIRPSTLADVLNGPRMQAGTIVKDAIPVSRILFPAIFMQAIEDKLLVNLTMTANAFDSMVGYEESITGYRYEQPVINYANPEAARAMGVGQLAQPASMMTITVLDKAYKIPSFALGLEVSDQALSATTLDFVTMSVARQAAVQRNELAQGYVLALLNGDTDNGDGSLASLGYSVNTSTLDATATTTWTQKAWIKFLMLNGTKRTLTHLITDIDTALKIEGRTNKPVITNDDSQTHRFDTQFNVMNPTWAKNPQLFLTQDANWPANTVMGLDKTWAIRRVRSLSADYNAIENYVMRRSTAMRVDFGEHVNRLYPEAYQAAVIA